MVTQLERPSRIERAGNQDKTKNSEKVNKKISFNFICMLCVALTLDLIGLVLNVFPVVGIIISFISNLIFIPWFYFSGIKFTNKKIVSMTVSSIAEYIPIVGNLPMITVNVIYSYYTK